MKKIQLTKAVLAALVLASTAVMADTDYPAADFQPKVLFSDPSVKTTSEPATAAIVVEKNEIDANFPAAHFQPKVVYADNSYQHSAAAPVAAGSKSTAVAKVADSAEAAEAGEQGSNNNLIGLLALAAVGFYFFNKKSTGSAVASSAADSYVVADGSTGVEKYLEKQGINKTGVAKYLDKQGSNPATGVAKYMAKQIVRDREASAKTGL